MFRRIISIVTLCICCLSLAAQSKYEIRAVWFTTNWGLDWPRNPARNREEMARQKEELCSLLDRVKAMNLNTVFFQTRLRGDVIYPSSYEPWNYILTGRSGGNPQYDPLAFAVEACHERGLQCHAWMVCMPLGSDKLVKAHGKNSVVSKHPAWCKMLDGEWYLNPGVPQTAGYISQLAGEIVSKYDVDGIHLDYIRYPDAADRFRDSDTFKKYGRKDQTLQAWRRENITRMVYAVYDEVKRLKPWVKVSSSPLGKHNTLNHYSAEGWSGIETVHQDAQRWLLDGKQDFVAPMIYFKDQNFYPFLYDWIKNKGDRFVISGLGAYRMAADEGNWSLSDFIRQITLGRVLKVDGQAFYRLENLTGNLKGVCDRLKSDLYRYPALFPPLTYLDSIPPVPVSGLRVGREEGDFRLSWSASDDQRGYVVYGSDRYPVDTQDSKQIVDIVYDTTCVVTRSDKIARNYYAVTAFDPCGNESLPTEITLSAGAVDTSACYVGSADRLLRLGKQYVGITVSDVLGRILFYQQNRSSVQLPVWPAGVYRLILEDQSKVLERKLLIIE